MQSSSNIEALIIIMIICGGGVGGGGGGVTIGVINNNCGHIKIAQSWDIYFNLSLISSAVMSVLYCSLAGTLSVAAIPLTELGQQSTSKLGAGPQCLPEGHISGKDHHLGVHGVRVALNQIPVSASVNIKCLPLMHSILFIDTINKMYFIYTYITL